MSIDNDCIISCYYYLYYWSYLLNKRILWLYSYILLNALYLVLFNLAFDPFLKSLIRNTELTGYQFQPSSSNATGDSSFHSTFRTPPPLKLLACADDVEVYCRKPRSFDAFMETYRKYFLVLNATLNRNKIVVFALNGSPTNRWIQHLFNHPIHTWHSYKRQGSQCSFNILINWWPKLVVWTLLYCLFYFWMAPLFFLIY
jgi:hypothetical protein